MKKPWLSHVAWNKGKTKYTDERLYKQGRTYSENVRSGKTILYWKGRKLSEEHKKHVSEGMKKAHLEGRAHNIGESRWNNEPSYPEKFFCKVIENHFVDKNYKREYPIEKYSLDFAWPEKQLCIEIDGEQHQRFKEYRERDIRKDKCINEHGWNVLRIPWKNLFHEPSKNIEIAKLFIEDFVIWWCDNKDMINIKNADEKYLDNSRIKIGSTEYLI